MALVSFNGYLFRSGKWKSFFNFDIRSKPVITICAVIVVNKNNVESNSVLVKNELWHLWSKSIVVCQVNRMDFHLVQIRFQLS